MVKTGYHPKKQTTSEFCLENNNVKNDFLPENKTLKTKTMLKCYTTGNTANTEARLTLKNRWQAKAVSGTLAEVYGFDDTDKIALFKKHSNKVALAVGLKILYMRPVIFVFDTGAGPKLLCEVIAEPEWTRSIRDSKKKRLQRVTKEKVEVVGAIMLHVRMEEAHVRVVLETVKNVVRSFSFGYLW